MVGRLASWAMLMAVAMPPLVPLTSAEMVATVAVPWPVFSALRSRREMAA